MTEPHDTQEPDELSLGGPPSLDPIGREIARMKIGDALFAQPEAQHTVARAPKPMWRRRALLASALIVMATLAIAYLR